MKVAVRLGHWGSESNSPTMARRANSVTWQTLAPTRRPRRPGAAAGRLEVTGSRHRHLNLGPDRDGNCDSIRLALSPG